MNSGFHRLFLSDLCYSELAMFFFLGLLACCFHVCCSLFQSVRAIHGSFVCVCPSFCGLYVPWHCRGVACFGPVLGCACHPWKVCCRRHASPPTEGPSVKLCVLIATCRETCCLKRDRQVRAECFCHLAENMEVADSMSVLPGFLARCCGF